MDPAVVVGQGLAECAGPAGHRALADLAAGDRELGDGGPAPARERTTRGRRVRVGVCQVMDRYAT